MPVKTCIVGAAGKMGTRISDSLRADSTYELFFVEGAAAGDDAIRSRGDAPCSLDVGAAEADIVVMAVPDRLISSIATVAVPLMRSGAMLVCLDPAAPHAGLIPDRDDIAIFVCHPSHPSVFNCETDLEARFDFFGSGKATQSIVCALMRGDESAYALGEALARAMWKPVSRAHRITVEQMAILEPALSETVGATCITIIREAMDEAVRRGVPEPAARDFILGHIFVELGIIFGETEFTFSDGAKLAIENAKSQLFRPDWKNVFEPEAILQSVIAITSADENGTSARSEQRNINGHPHSGEAHNRGATVKS